MINFDADQMNKTEEQSDVETVDAQSQHNELTTCKEKLTKAQEQYIYLQADFENFRRNMTKERAQWTRSAQTKIFEDLVGIIDDFSLAIADFKKHIETDQSPVSEAEKARFHGMELIYKNFLKFLEAHEIKEVPTAGVFNPNLHEALMQVPVEGKESGTIIDVLQKGYMHKDTVIRVAKVTVAQ